MAFGHRMRGERSAYDERHREMEAARRRNLEAAGRAGELAARRRIGRVFAAAYAALAMGLALAWALS
ncbi:MAG: hypothetical protein OXI50_06605 [Gammaproteobacteria bacterium]|nr:hypothetical protein [Gammaproteobacteria bacterium]